MLLFYSVSSEQCIDCWPLSAEAFVERHRMFGASFRQDAVAERLRHFAVEYAFLLK